MYEPTRQERRIEQRFKEKLKEFMEAYTSGVYETPDAAREAFEHYNKQWKAYCNNVNNQKKIQRLTVRAACGDFEKYAEQLGIRPTAPENITTQL